MKDRAKTYLQYSGAVFLAILSIAVLLSIFIFFQRKHPDGMKSISVEASAEVSAKPNIARFSFSVSETAKNPKEAQKRVNEKISKILSKLRELGIDEKDVKTENYNIHPKYEWVRTKEGEKESPEGIIYYPGKDKKRVLVGYELNQNISLKIRDFTKIPDVLEILADSGVENLYGPNFQIEDPDALKEKAKLEAMRKARAKAERIAKELGLKLGKVTSFSEGNNYPIYRAMPTMALKSVGVEENASPELPAGENTIRSTVRISYEVK